MINYKKFFFLRANLTWSQTHYKIFFCIFVILIKNILQYTLHCEIIQWKNKIQLNDMYILYQDNFWWIFLFAVTLPCERLSLPRKLKRSLLFVCILMYILKMLFQYGLLLLTNIVRGYKLFEGIILHMQMWHGKINWYIITHINSRVSVKVNSLNYFNFSLQNTKPLMT